MYNFMPLVTKDVITYLAYNDNKENVGDDFVNNCLRNGRLMFKADTTYLHNG